MRLPREERAEVVASLRESGLSLRAIAAATGLNHQTVSNDLSKNRQLHDAADREFSPVPNGTPEPLERRTTVVTHGGGFVGPGEEIPCDTKTLIDVDTGDELASELIVAEQHLPPLPENYT